MATTSDICRFCLFGQEEKHNPLLSPCQCRGSVQWVHRICLQKWIIMSESLTNCQLCKVDYQIPRSMKLEIIPRPADDGAWYFLSRPYGPMVLLYFYAVHVVNTYPTLFDYIHHFTFFSALLSAYSLLYVGYYTPYIRSIHNKPRYLRYWLRTELLYENYMYNPLALLCFSAFNYLAVPICGIGPFGGLYIWSLPKFMDTHRAICYTMNLEIATQE